MQINSLHCVDLAKEGESYSNVVYDITKEQDSELASLKLSTTGITIDELTDEQIKYSTDYSAGT